MRATARQGMTTRSMSFGDRGSGIRHRALWAALIAACALLAATASASADTTFGGDPTLVAPAEEGGTAGSCGPVSCTLYWTGPGGTDLAPIPASGGSGTVTSVTLPAMHEPGTMQAVVLTSSVTATGDPANPTRSCCQVKEVSAPFTVPANAITTVPLSLHVEATAAANLSVKGATSTADGVGISILTPNASLPVRATENGADALLFWAPAMEAPAPPTAEGSAGNKPGYELQALFTFAEAAQPPPVAHGPGPPRVTPTPKPGQGGAPAKTGVKLRRGALRPGTDGRTLTLGTAKNPPTAKTKQTLTLPAARASAAGKAKPIVIGTGRTVVPTGKSAPLKLKLNAKGRARLAQGKPLKVTLTVVATNSAGEAGTLTRSVTLKPAKKSKRRAS
jgi:hypothetical protein